MIDFDWIMNFMNAPNYPSECVECGAKGTNETMKEHECGRSKIPCCNCGKLTVWDPTYQNLCYRCIRADNE